MCRKSETLTQTKSVELASRGAQLVNGRPPENSHPSPNIDAHVGRRVCEAPKQALGTSCKGSGISLFLKAVTKQKSGEVARPRADVRAPLVGGKGVLEGRSGIRVIARIAFEGLQHGGHASRVLWPPWASQNERGQCMLAPGPGAWVVWVNKRCCLCASEGARRVVHTNDEDTDA